MAEKRPPAVYLDSCVLIDIIAKMKPFCDQMDPLIGDAETGTTVILASSMCVAEVGASKAKFPASELDRLDDFFRQSYFEFRAVTQDIARSARALAYNHAVKPADAIHLATCIASGVRWFITRDGDEVGNGKTRKGKLLKLDQTFPMAVGLLRIVTPEHYQDAMYGYTINFPTSPP
jgi:predicted nucleic acid-binding protein